MLNLCANNYLGLADHPEVIAAAHDALEKWGYGLASVRFICGTQQIHKQLEGKISEFLGTDDTVFGEDDAALGTILVNRQGDRHYAMREDGATVFEIRDYMFTRLDKQQSDFVEAPAAD